MKKKALYLILPIITLCLELLPYGAVCIFASGPNELHREVFSYFSLVPFGYANFTPLITAVMTCVMVLLLVIYCITGKKRLAVSARRLSYVCTAFSFGQLYFGIEYYSVVGVLITISLVAETLLLHFGFKVTE